MQKWDSRDWKWLVGILIGVIILILAAWLYRMPDVLNYFSFISSGISIALALIAIYISLSQNSNSEILNAKTSDILARIEEKISNVNEKVNKIDPKEIAMITETRVNGALSQFSEELYKKLEEVGIDKDKIKEIKENIKSTSNVINLPSVYNYNKDVFKESDIDISDPEIPDIKMLQFNQVIRDEVKGVLSVIKDKSFSDSIGIINTTSITNQAREILYASLVKGHLKKKRDGNDGIYDALENMYSFISPPLFKECIG